jgi:hypothetical protein
VGRSECWSTEERSLLDDEAVARRVEVPGLSDGVRMKGALVVRRTGDIVAIGGEVYGDGLFTTPVALGVHDIVDASGGLEAGCAVRATGGIVCWGDALEQRLTR